MLSLSAAQYVGPNHGQAQDLGLPRQPKPQVRGAQPAIWCLSAGSPCLSYLCCPPNSCRAAAPAFPTTLAPTSLSHDDAAAFGCRALMRVRRAPDKGQHHMNSTFRRTNGARPQTPHRPRNPTGNARQQYERYLAGAREAQRAGDEIEMENCFQHAEHYFRMMQAGGGADEKRSQ